MEPIENPVPGEWYFGYQCRCGELVLLMKDPGSTGGFPKGIDPTPVTCRSCGLKTAVAPIQWQRLRTK